MNKTQIVRKDAKQDTTCSRNGSRSNNDNVNSFPKLGEKRVNLRTCLDLIRGIDYKEKKAKLPKNKSQCQKCGLPCCPTHLLNICNKQQ